MKCRTEKKLDRIGYWQIAVELSIVTSFSMIDDPPLWENSGSWVYIVIFEYYRGTAIYV